MDQLPSGYLAQIASQMGFLSAFLGGVAATLLALLLDDRPRSRAVAWAIGCAAAAAVAFIASVVCSTMLSTVLHPEAPANLVREASIMKARAIGTSASSWAFIYFSPASGCADGYGRDRWASPRPLWRSWAACSSPGR